MERATQKQPDIRFVDPYTFFDLMKLHLVARDSVARPEPPAMGVGTNKSIVPIPSTYGELQ